MNFFVRPMRSEDIPQVFAVDKASAALYWPESSYHFEVERNENSRPFVAVDESGVVIGFVVFWLILDEAHLANVAVREPFRNQGVARALIRAGLDACAEGGAAVSLLEVRAGNAPALHLYRSLGFVQVGERKGYYQDNHEDALLMDLDMRLLSSDAAEERRHE